MRLQEKVAIITGTASGIGAATARALAREGARIVVADMQEAAAERVASEIRATGPEAVSIVTDVADPEQVTRMA